MKQSYDFSKAERNPYANRLKKQITIRVDVDVLGYFGALSQQLGIPYQTLMNLYLRDCAVSKLQPALHWAVEEDSPRGKGTVKPGTKVRNPPLGSRSRR